MSFKLRLGVIVSLAKGAEAEIKKVHDFGLSTCQVSCWNPDLYNDDTLRSLMDACEKYEVEVTSIWAGYPGPAVWNFIDGPATIGLVPPEYRTMRVDALKKLPTSPLERALPRLPRMQASFLKAQKIRCIRIQSVRYRKLPNTASAQVYISVSRLDKRHLLRFFERSRTLEWITSA